ncbi:XdhC family protein [Erwinia sp. P6884]|uniref:XdhC family protein n=1 Tax=Erwinia sp. P6884 TaxID=3141450 RepID=UPI0031932252
MQNLDREVLRQARHWNHQDPVWLCTVLSTFGSSPRPPGTMMVIHGDGSYCGSLSGGCVEEDFLQRLGEGAFRQPSQIIRYGEGGLHPSQALPCGGVVDILIEYLPPDAHSQACLLQMEEALNGTVTLRKELRLPHRCISLERCDYASSTLARYDSEKVVLTLAAAPRLIVAGLSGVAVFCANFAEALGFEVIVLETRPEFIHNFSPLLSPALSVQQTFPAKYIERQGCHAHSAVVALTHDPRIDDLTLMEAMHTPAFYIGAMGSAGNSKKRCDRLREYGEFSDKEIARIHAPIGMDIGSKTPAEIALAVMADIVRYKNGVMNSPQA